MLAHEFKEDSHKTKVIGWWISEKYDGVRGLWDAEKKTMFSRNGNVYTLPDFITKQLIESGISLDGEIWFGRETFDLCSGAARKDVNQDEVWKAMTFMVFDTPDLKLPFEDRVKLLHTSIKGLPNIKGVKHYKYKEDMNLDAELKKIEDLGGEGLVLRKPGSRYVVKRSHDMLKVKSWVYKEAEVTGYNEGAGRLNGMVGSLKIKNTEFGSFKVGSGLNDWQRSSLDNNERISIKNEQLHTKKEYDNKHYSKLLDIIMSNDSPTDNDQKKKKYKAIRQINSDYVSMPVIGDIITFRYKEVTKDGNPKFPTFIGVRDYE
jgi:DNA ligase-1